MAGGRSHGRISAPLAGVIAGLVVAGSALALAAAAAAVDHNIRIREVFAGATTGQPGARFVELQLANSGQNTVTGNRVHVYNAASTNVGTFTFPADMPNGANQASILVATSQAATLFGVTPDLSMGAAIPPKGGQVCYEDTDGGTVGFIDCVAWGNFTGASPSPTGSPFGPVSGIPNGRSILRDISAGNPALLETGPGGGPGGDDTDDSAADFDPAFPEPRNNASAVTTTAGSASVDASGVLNFVAATGVKNKLTVAPSGAFWRLTDQVAPIVPGTGCETVTVNRVRCLQAGVTGGLSIDGGDLNDEITTPNGIDVTVDGGAGDDRITTRNGADTLLGAVGRDILDGGFGPDTLDGAENQDTVTYDKRTAGQPVTVDLDGAVGDDGGAEDDDGLGNRDTVANVEILKGGAGGDALTGNSAPNKLFGFAGADQLHGLAANDEIRAKDGGTVDTITCGAGPKDRLFADLGVDIFNDVESDCEIVS